MIKKAVVTLLMLGVFYCVSSTPAHSQTINCTGPFYCYFGSLWFMSCQPPPPPVVFNCQAFLIWEVVCSYETAACPPAKAKDEVCVRCQTGGSPISLLTGNTFIDETDVKVPGLSGGLTLSRTWNSKWPSTQTLKQVGLFGPNWRSTYEEQIFVGSDNYIKYSRSDGSFWSFGYAGAAYAPAAPANISATLTYDLNNWTLTFQNGEKRIFSFLTGKLTSIVDRNGNTTQLSYDSQFRLATVADPGGRHLYFGYASGSTYLVTSITSDIGISLSYTYDTQGRLTQVTNPDSTTISFEYNSNSLITAVKDSNGQVLESHTYDSQGRGLTSSRDSGVEAITVTY